MEGRYENCLLLGLWPLVVDKFIFKFCLLIQGDVGVELVVSGRPSYVQHVLQSAARVLNGLHAQEVFPNTGEILLENVEAHRIDFLMAVEQSHIDVGRIFENLLEAVSSVGLGINHLRHNIQLDL